MFDAAYRHSMAPVRHVTFCAQVQRPSLRCPGENVAKNECQSLVYVAEKRYLLIGTASYADSRPCCDLFFLLTDDQQH